MTLAAGTITFTPTANYSGPAAFTYTVSDGNGGSATGTVNITVDPVNDDPVAVADAFTINEDTALVIAAGSLTANDTDIDGGALSVTSVQGALNGTVTLAAGTITFTPTANYSGPAAFTYTVVDGNGGSDTGTVNITVDPVNDAPVAVDDAFTINEDTALVIAAASLTANDTDIDGGALSVTSVQGALNGTVTLAAGTITFTPTANYSGPAAFTYTVS